MSFLPALIVLWLLVMALLTVPAFWRGEQPELETWGNGRAEAGPTEDLRHAA